MREQKHFAVVEVERIEQARRLEQQQGDDGRQQLWERPSCPCLGDALVMGVSRFYLTGVSALMAELVRGAMLFRCASLAKVVWLNRQVSGSIGDKGLVVKKCLESRKVQPRSPSQSSEQQAQAARCQGRASTCVQVTPRSCLSILADSHFFTSPLPRRLDSYSGAISPHTG